MLDDSDLKAEIGGDKATKEDTGSSVLEQTDLDRKAALFAQAASLIERPSNPLSTHQQQQHARSSQPSTSIREVSAATPVSASPAGPNEVWERQGIWGNQLVRSRADATAPAAGNIRRKVAKLEAHTRVSKPDAINKKITRASWRISRPSAA